VEEQRPSADHGLATPLGRTSAKAELHETFAVRLEAVRHQLDMLEAKMDRMLAAWLLKAYGRIRQ
jgi:hypothetical protein